MKKSESITIPIGQHKIKCSQCGNDKNKFYLVSTDLPKTIGEIAYVSLGGEAQMTQQQQYLSHIFEAQNRFGE